MKVSEITDKLVGKSIKYEKEVMTFIGPKIYQFEGEIIGVSKHDTFIDITIYRECGLPYSSSIDHIGINFKSGYNTIENAKIL